MKFQIVKLLIVFLLVPNLYSDPLTRNVVILLDIFSGGGICESNNGIDFNSYYFNAAIDYNKSFIVVSGNILHSWLTYIKFFKDNENQYKKLIDETNDLMIKAEINTESFNPFDKNALSLQAHNILQKQLTDNLVFMEYLKDLDSKNSTQMDNIIKKKQNLLTQMSNRNISEAQYYEEDQKLDQILKEQNDNILEEHRKNLQRLKIGQNKTDFFNKQMINLEKHNINPIFINSFDNYKRYDKFLNYNIFKCVNTSEYILIPKAFSDKFVLESFHTNNPLILQSLTLDELEDDLELQGMTPLKKDKTFLASILGKCKNFLNKIKSGKWQKHIEWQQLKKIFTKESSNWIFALIGHGWYSSPRFQKNESLCPEHCKDFNSVLKNSGYIASLTLDNYYHFLFDLGFSIKTLALFSKTCFGGGYHLNQTVQRLKEYQQDSSFTPYLYFNGTLTDTYSYGFPIIESINFAQFFEYLEKYFINNEDTIKQALIAISQKEKDIDNKYEFYSVLSTPSLFNPKTNTVEIIDITDSLVFLNDKNNDAKLDIAKKTNGILLFKQDNVIQLNLMPREGKGGPLFVSMIPKDAIHHIGELNIKYGFDEFLKESIFKYAEISKKTFMFNDLSAINYNESGINDLNKLNLENVVINKNYYIKGYGIFDNSLRAMGTIFIKLKNENKFFKAYIQGNYNWTIDPTISKFEPATEKEFVNALDF